MAACFGAWCQGHPSAIACEKRRALAKAMQVTAETCGPKDQSRLGELLEAKGCAPADLLFDGFEARRQPPK